MALVDSSDTARTATGRRPGASALANAPLTVMKFGGTSVADTERIRRVAERAVAAQRAGHRVVIVASAMGATTDELSRLAHEVSDAPHRRELDMLLSTGERITCSLIAMAIHDLGERAVSLTGSQAGIVTDTDHTRARILDIRAFRVQEALEGGAIVLVAGFQGVSTDKDVTTLGRGGSDATAVALAAALGAETCEIYTDVDGVFTADPRVVPDARLLHAVSYDEMLEMSASGARVLMLRAVEFARSYDVVLHVRSSFTDAQGTFVREADTRMEHAYISGVTHDTDLARVTVHGVPEDPAAVAAIFRAVAGAGARVDMLLQVAAAGGQNDVAFTVPEADLADLTPVLDGVVADVAAASWNADQDIGLVSLVGAGLQSHPDVAARLFDVLAELGVNTELVATGPIRISCIIPASAVPDATRALHAAFDVGTMAEGREHVHG